MGRVDEIANRYVDEWAPLNPLDATASGITGYDAEMADLSPGGLDATVELDRRTLAELAAVAPADERERVAKAAMQERLGLGLELDEAGGRAMISVIASGLHSARQVFDLMPTEGEQALADIASRLAKVPTALAGYRLTLLDELARGRVSARRQVVKVAEQCATWSDADGEDFYGGLVGRLTAGGVLRADLDAGAAAARAATAEFGRFLRAELAPHARERNAVGREAYGLHSRFFLGARVDLDETYAWGWEELARIEDEMRAVATRIVPDGGIDEAAAALGADPARRIGTKEEFRDWMQALADKAIADLHGTHFDIPEPARRIECMLAPTSDGGIYYTGPSEDFSRPGRMWWAVPHGVRGFETWREVTTVYHEGVPGHHLQVAQTQYRAELLNRWQRLLCWTSGHGEGWALYAERLMDDLGYLDDPGDKLGMLDAQRFRAARVIVDIGMHLELPIPADNPTGFHPGEVWNADLGWDFMRAHCAMDDEFLRFELDRYLGWPGQAPAYKVGERIWLQAREDARHRAGAAFDLKSFHRAALDLGSIGLDPLQDALSRL